MEVGGVQDPIHAMREAQHSKSTLSEGNERIAPFYLVQLRDFRIVMTAPIV